MTIELTEQQQLALDSFGETPSVIDPRTKARYFLISEEDYQIVRETLEEERKQQAIHRIALRNAAGRMEDEP